MEIPKLIYKIKSKYIFKIIFDFIEKDNFIYKLFFTSKKLQNMFGISIGDYQCLYFSINLFRYLSENCQIKDYYPGILEESLKKDLNLYDFKNSLPSNYIIYFFKKNLEKLEDTELSIYSPFFKILSENEIFKYFNISISVQKIEKYQLENDFLNAFQKLNDYYNANYSSIILKCQNNNDLKYLNKFKINLDNLKKLSLLPDPNIFDFKSFNDLLYNLFSINNIKNNLLELKIKLESNIIINNDIMENLNDFKGLEKLELSRFDIKGYFTLKLINLKSLNLYICNNIAFENGFGLNLKKLWISSCKLIQKRNSLIKLPKLEECSLLDSNEMSYNLIIDFKSLKNLKYFDGTSKYFLLLENSPLEYIHFTRSDKNIEKQTFEKLLYLKSLKEINDFGLFQLKDKEIYNIKNINYSVEKISIQWNAPEDDSIIYFINKFPNLNKFSLTVLNNERENYNFQIKEKANYKIDKIDINCTMGIPKNFELYCNSYRNLKEFHLISDYHEIMNVQLILPIFNSYCTTKFSSLLIFEFVYNYNEINLDILNNIYINSKKMSNLKYFKLDCFSKKISEEFHFNFIKILFSINLDYIFFRIKNKYLTGNKYPIEELRSKIPKFNSIKDVCNINVYKLA